MSEKEDIKPGSLWRATRRFAGSNGVEGLPGDLIVVISETKKIVSGYSSVWKCMFRGHVLNVSELNLRPGEMFELVENSDA